MVALMKIGLRSPHYSYICEIWYEDIFRLFCIENAYRGVCTKTCKIQEIK